MVKFSFLLILLSYSCTPKKNIDQSSRFLSFGNRYEMPVPSKYNVKQGVGDDTEFLILTSLSNRIQLNIEYPIRSSQLELENKLKEFSEEKQIKGKIQELEFHYKRIDVQLRNIEGLLIEKTNESTYHLVFGVSLNENDFPEFVKIAQTITLK